jgi:hypothetical protein
MRGAVKRGRTSRNRTPHGRTSHGQCATRLGGAGSGMATVPLQSDLGGMAALLAG